MTEKIQKNAIAALAKALEDVGLNSREAGLAAERHVTQIVGEADQQIERVVYG